MRSINQSNIWLCKELTLRDFILSTKPTGNLPAMAPKYLRLNTVIKYACLVSVVSLACHILSSLFVQVHYGTLFYSYTVETSSPLLIFSWLSLSLLNTWELVHHLCSISLFLFVFFMTASDGLLLCPHLSIFFLNTGIMSIHPIHSFIQLTISLALNHVQTLAVSVGNKKVIGPPKRACNLLGKANDKEEIIQSVWYPQNLAI